MNIKYALIPLIALSLVACGGGSDGGSPSYNSCRIIESNAASTSNKTNDLLQCWAIRATEDQQNAQAQCAQLVEDYMNRRYGRIQHGLKYQVSSDSCP